MVKHSKKTDVFQHSNLRIWFPDCPKINWKSDFSKLDSQIVPQKKTMHLFERTKEGMIFFPLDMTRYFFLRVGLRILRNLLAIVFIHQPKMKKLRDDMVLF